MKKVVSTVDAPAAVGPYSQAVAAGDFVFVSGQIGIDPSTGKMVDGGVERQVEMILENIGAILRSGGLDLSSVVKTTVLLQSMDDFPAMNEVYKGFFPVDPPARAAFEVGMLPLGAFVEIEAIAFRG